MKILHFKLYAYILLHQALYTVVNDQSQFSYMWHCIKALLYMPVVNGEIKKFGQHNKG